MLALSVSTYIAEKPRCETAKSKIGHEKKAWEGQKGPPKLFTIYIHVRWANRGHLPICFTGHIMFFFPCFSLTAVGMSSLPKGI